MTDHESLPAVTVIGAGGHAKVVIRTLVSQGYEVAMVLDDDPAKLGGTVCGIQVPGRPQDFLRPGAHAVLAIGGNRERQVLADRFSGVHWLTVVHPHACVDASVDLGPGTVVFAGAVIQPDAVVGSHVIVNTGATIDHDCRIGSFAHLCPGVHLAGGVTVGQGATLGVGGAVKPGVTIGSWVTVGAGAAVVSDLPGSVIAFGVPARIRDKEGG